MKDSPHRHLSKRMDCQSQMARLLLCFGKVAPAPFCLSSMTIQVIRTDLCRRRTSPEGASNEIVSSGRKGVVRRWEWTRCRTCRIFRTAFAPIEVGQASSCLLSHALGFGSLAYFN
jgi:hypothetical protein